MPSFRGIPEPLLSEMITKFSTSSGAFYDVGGCQGKYAVMAAPHFSQVYSFECWEGWMEDIFSFTKDIPNIEVVRKAVWSEDMVKDFHLPLAHKGGLGSLVKVRTPEYYCGETTPIECITIDTFVKSHAPPAFIKLDVEGAELKVLRGAVQTLKDYTPVIYVEYHTAELKPQGDAFLRRLGYVIYATIVQNQQVSRVGYVPKNTGL